MIANIVTDDDGYPIDGNGNKLSKSSYNPPEEVKQLFARIQIDYQTAWSLQHRGFDEFDGYSLLDRARLDQETFGAFVGIKQESASKQWRWKGRKNTARNKIIGILAHVIAGMLFPYCYAYNEDDEQDEMTARVMRILIEDYLKKADYEIKFLFMITSALVNPAVFVEVEYLEAMQKIKIRNPDGTYRIEEAVDELLTGINLNIVPIDQVLLADFYTFDNQRQPYMVRSKRIPWDEARKIYAGKYFIDGVDQFDFVTAGMTKILIAGEEGETLYDIDWTEADRNYVQVLNVKYRPEDLEVEFVGGVFMGEYEDIYNSNPFKHRRMSMIGNKWLSIPVYNIAKSGFEPLDPSGRFAYYKSASFKEFWDDAGQNRMHQIAYDGTFLDVIKPLFISGGATPDQSVMIPGATVAMPMGASVTPYTLGPNLVAALNMMRQETDDMSESTQDSNSNGIAQPNVTAFATAKAQQNAQIIIGVFSVMIADLVRQIGDLVMDCIIMHTTVGEIDATIPGDLNMKYKTLIMQGKDGGTDVTNKITFDTNMMGEKMSKEQLNDMEWDIFNKSGKLDTKQRNYVVNPYNFARTRFLLYIDPSAITSRSMGTDQLRKDRAFNLLMDPRVMPYIDPQAVIDKFVLDEYSDGDPDEFKKKIQPGQDMLSAVMGQNGQPAPEAPIPIGQQVAPPQTVG